MVLVILREAVVAPILIGIMAVVLVETLILQGIILQLVLVHNRPVAAVSGLTGEHVPAGPPAILTLLLPAAPPLVGHLQGHLQGHVLLVIIG